MPLFEEQYIPRDAGLLAREMDHGARQAELAQRMQAPNAAKAWWEGLHPLDKAALLTGPVPVLGDITGAAADIRMFAEEPESRTWGNAGLAALGLLPFVPGMAGIIAGKGAKTADLAKMRLAKQMSKKGDDIADIHKKTGWWQGPDGQWRFEIDDSGSVPLRRTGGEAEGLKRGESTVTRRQRALAHPKLSAAYPETKEIPVFLDPGSGISGSFQDDGPFGPMIRSNADPKYGYKANRSTTLHELQHAIQGREGFARGGSPDVYARGPMFSEKARELSADLSMALTGTVDVRPEDIFIDMKYGDPSQLKGIAKKYGFKDLDDALEFLKAEDFKRTPYGQYNRLAGEAEARMVQTRMNLTPAQRAARPPWLDFDVPIDEQIVRFK